VVVKSTGQARIAHMTHGLKTLTFNEKPKRIFCPIKAVKSAGRYREIAYQCHK